MEIAPVLCAGVTVYKGLKYDRGQGLMGCDIGHWRARTPGGAVRQANGIKVAAIDVDDEKLELAERLGASLRLTPSRSTRGHSSRRNLAAHTVCW